MDYETNRTEYKPTFPLSVYREWLKRNLGTAEQQKRYQAAVEWYKQAKLEKEN